MRSNPTYFTPAAVAALVVALLAASHSQAGGATIIPLEQARSVSTLLIVPQCLGKTSDSDAAEGFDPFEGFVETVLGCDSGFGSASAAQQSQIDESSMTASGSGRSDAGGPVPNVIHAFGDSLFRVTFELPAASNFQLNGVLSAASSPEPAVLVGALISLRDAQQQVIFQHLVEPGPGGKPNTQVVEEADVLEAGVYTLQAEAGSFIDNDVPPSRAGDTSFELTFNVSVLGDLNGDGVVGIGDLLALLAAWGPCADCDSCPADLNGDCTVGVADLLLLFANWG